MHNPPMCTGNCFASLYFNGGIISLCVPLFVLAKVYQLIPLCRTLPVWDCLALEFTQLPDRQVMLNKLKREAKQGQHGQLSNATAGPGTVLCMDMSHSTAWCWWWANRNIIGMFKHTDGILSSRMSSSCHYVSAIPSFSSGQDNLDLIGDTERIIVMSIQPKFKWFSAAASDGSVTWLFSAIIKNTILELMYTGYWHCQIFR